MIKYFSDFLFTAPKIYDLYLEEEKDKNIPLNKQIWYLRLNEQEEKQQCEDIDWECRNPYPIHELIVNEKYLRKEIMKFFKWTDVTTDKLQRLNKSFKYWVAFVNVSSLYLQTPKINYISNIHYVEFWENYYKNN